LAKPPPLAFVVPPGKMSVMIPLVMLLQGKVGIVTGAGSGIGRATAMRFAQEGAQVTIVDIDATHGSAVADSISSDGGTALFIQADVSRSDQCERLVRETVARFGRLNILFNNAGIARVNLDGPIADLDEQTWDLILAVNLKSVFLCSKFALPEMIRAGGGAIVNMASIAGLTVCERPCYAASKAGVMSLTRTLAAQYANARIRVNAIAPGVVDTNLDASAQGLAALGDPARFVERFPYPGPLIGRNAKPDEIAPLVVFLASDQASYITGTTIAIDGGVTAR
jgi:NAD(P)-dependent dehydrogenase (short-subunit alcohol dehydrogenase family)